MTSLRRGAAAMTALAVLATLASGCSNRESPRFKSTGQHSAVTATRGPDGVQRVDIDTTDADRFVPDTVVVHPGKVTLVVHNPGVVPHTLEIPVLGVDTGNIGKHQTRTVSFTARKPGSYRFDCAYHVTLHMEGSLQVVSG